MSILKEVAVSGTVGKQVFATTVKTILKSVSLFAPSGAATVTIRDGNASGETVYRMATGLASVSALAGSKDMMFSKEGIRFDKGMHVKVIGTAAAAYLELY